MSAAKKATQKSEQAKLAEQVVLKIGLDLLGRMGDEFDCSVYKEYGLEGTIKVSKAIAVFKWIVAQTNGFNRPLFVRFRHGEATLVAMCFVHIDAELSNALYDLNKTIGPLPQSGTGWSGGPGSTYFQISDLRRTRGMVGHGLEGVDIVNICGKEPLPERAVMLSSILQ